MEQANIALVYALTGLISVVTLVIAGWSVYALIDLIREFKTWPETMKLFRGNRYEG